MIHIKQLVKIKTMFNTIIDKNEFEDIFYKLSLIVGIFLSIFTSMKNVFFDYKIITVFLPLFVGVFAIITHFTVYKRNKNLSTILNIININFVFSPFMWLTKSGYNGGFQYFFFLFLVISITVLKGISRIIIVGAYISLAFGLMIFGKMNPQLIFELSGGKQRNVADISVNFILCLILFTIIAFVLSYLYSYRQNKIKELTVKDPLTKQYNRRYILNTLEKLYTENTKEPENRYAVFIDVDDFKNVNDNYGHSEGDKVLCKLCESINNNIRSSDYLARMGGDEFLLIITTPDIHYAELLVNRLITSIKKDADVTISAGLTPLKGKSSLSELLEKADNVMYAAKRNGKNQVLITREDPI